MNLIKTWWWFWLACAFLGINIGNVIRFAIEGQWPLLCVSALGVITSSLWMWVARWGALHAKRAA